MGARTPLARINVSPLTQFHLPDRRQLTIAAIALHEIMLSMSQSAIFLPALESSTICRFPRLIRNPADRGHRSLRLQGPVNLLGIDHTRLTYYHNGIRRQLTNVHGAVIKPILA